MRGCRGLTGVGLSSGRRCMVGRVRARVVLSVQVPVPSSARGESRTLTGLPPGDFEYATYGEDRGIAGSYGHFSAAVLPEGPPLAPVVLRSSCHGRPLPLRPACLIVPALVDDTQLGAQQDLELLHAVRRVPAPRDVVARGPGGLGEYERLFERHERLVDLLLDRDREVQRVREEVVPRSRVGPRRLLDGRVPRRLAELCERRLTIGRPRCQHGLLDGTGKALDSHVVMEVGETIRVERGFRRDAEEAHD